MANYASFLECFQAIIGWFNKKYGNGYTMRIFSGLIYIFVSSNP